MKAFIATVLMLSGAAMLLAGCGQNSAEPQTEPSAIPTSRSGAWYMEHSLRMLADLESRHAITQDEYTQLRSRIVRVIQANMDKGILKPDKGYEMAQSVNSISEQLQSIQRLSAAGRVTADEAARLRSSAIESFDLK